METAEINDARSAAKAFFDAMLEWEIWNPTVPFSLESAPERLRRLVPIFERHLSAKALQRGQSRYDMLGYQMPPEFEGPILETEEAGKDKVWVYVPTGDSGGRARFLMKKENGQWKVDTREADPGNQGKWQKTPHL